MASVTFENIGKRFAQTQVLRGVSLTIADGEFVALLGPSGCGKTTLLRILAGLEHQSEGRVFLGANPVDHLPPKARDVAMVFQNYALYPYMSVRENVALPLVMRRMTALQRFPVVGRLMPGARAAMRSIDEAVEHACAGLGLDALLDRRPGQLSGGQRQRVALARAMVREPAAFLMDEPLSNLDAKLRHQARQEIVGLHRQLGATFIYVTHDQAEAMTMADRVAVMLDGRIVQCGLPQALYADPQDIRVAAFIGTPQINRFPATATDQGVRMADLTLPLLASAAPGTPLQLCFRPEALALSRTGSGLPVRLTAIEHLGPETLLHGQLDGAGPHLAIRVSPEAAGGLTTGALVQAQPDLARALAFDLEGRRLALRTGAASQSRAPAEAVHA